LGYGIIISLDDAMKRKQKRKEKKPNLLKRIWYWVFPKRNIEPRKHTMSKKEKVVNYTPEMAKEIVETYTANPTKETVESLAVKFGKTSRSIVAKLSREGVYKKAEYVAKNGDKPETKESKVERIAKAMGTSSEKLGGLEAATKSALDLILAALAPAEAETETESDATA
jgi:hypothetical protein